MRKIKTHTRRLVSAVPYVVAIAALVAAALIWRTWPDTDMGNPWLGFTMLVLGGMIHGVLEAPATVDEPDSNAIGRAIADPGAYVERWDHDDERNYGEIEPEQQWKTRAVLAALRGEPTRSPAERI